MIVNPGISGHAFSIQQSPVTISNHIRYTVAIETGTTMGRDSSTESTTGSPKKTPVRGVTSLVKARTAMHVVGIRLIFRVIAYALGQIHKMLDQMRRA